MQKYTVVTHSRNFHLDELMAIVLLNKYLLKGNYELIRTRDANIVNKHKELKNSFVIDVGYEFEPNKNNFDHHQKGFNHTWDNGTPLSSCGLVWKHLFDNTNVMENQISKDEKLNIDNKIIQKIDAQDNGVGDWNDGAILSMFNRNHHEDELMDKHFKKALDLATDYFNNYLVSLRSDIKNYSFNVDAAIAIAILNKYLLTEYDERIKKYDLELLKPYILEIGLDKKWDDGSPCGLCGIVWHYLWEKTTFMSMKMNDELKSNFEEKLIKKIDSGKWNEGNVLKMYDSRDGDR